MRCETRIEEWKIILRRFWKEFEKIWVQNRSDPEGRFWAVYGSKIEVIPPKLSHRPFLKLFSQIFSNSSQNHPIHIVETKITGCEMRNTNRGMENNFEKILRRIWEDLGGHIWYLRKFSGHIWTTCDSKSPDSHRGKQNNRMWDAKHESRNGK